MIDLYGSVCRLDGTQIITIMIMRRVLCNTTSCMLVNRHT